MMPGIEAMIREAEKTLGLGEPNYIQAWYPGLSGNFAWCNAAVSYWAWKSGNQGAVTWGGHYAYTVAHAARFKAKGTWHVDVAGIRRGDIVFFDWAGTDNISMIDHVGIVTGTGPGGAVLTIEGNIGNQCLRKVRYANTIAGYGRPVYEQPVAAPVKPKPVPVVVKPKPKPKPVVPQFEPYPGAGFFKAGARSSVFTRMGRRLVQEGCGDYFIGPGPMWTNSDVRSYAKWQRKQGFRGDDANGIPGKTTWDALRVPRS